MLIVLCRFLPTHQTYSFDVMILVTTILKFTSRNSKNQSWLGAQGAAIPTLTGLLGVFASDAGTTPVSKREVGNYSCTHTTAVPKHHGYLWQLILYPALSE